MKVIDHNRSSYPRILLIFAQVVLLLSVSSCNKRPSSFNIGADISFVPQFEARGAVYYGADGVQKDIVQLFSDYKFDYIRLRIFVDPSAERGYSRDGFCDFDNTAKMAARIKSAGMKFALDFHFSDTWADPDKQTKPSSWKGLTGEELDNALYDYVKDVLSRLKAMDLAPDMVQIGNEINHGIVWPEGRIDDNATEENWISFFNLYKAGQKAVKECLPGAKIMVHLALGGQNGLCRQFLDYMNKYDARFDIIGLSYYDQWHGTLGDLKLNIDDLASRYKKPICVCEYSGPHIKEINDIVRSTPHNLGFGTMYWEPVRELFPEGHISETMNIFKEIDRQYADAANQPVVNTPDKRVVSFKEPLIGADISWAQEQEDKGTVFADGGVNQDLLDILKNNKFNWIRLRLFVDPTAENGYSKDGYCDLEHTLAMAERIKNAGMKFLLDFHYSDTWADPGKQFTPASWSRFHGSGLEGQVYRYTNETIKRFIQQGVTPDMVQIGNEVDHGILWPQGKITDSSYMSLGVILRCASAGVRAADPDIKIMIHVANSGQIEESIRLIDKIISRDVVFDVIGQSYYPKWHGTLDELSGNLNYMAERYQKPMVVVEYQDDITEINRILKDLPNGLGLGSFIWEPTSPHWGSLFDENGNSTEKLTVFPGIYNSYKNNQ